MAYTEQKTIEKMELAMQHPESLYNSDVISYSGKTSDTRRYYSEVCSECLLGRLGKNPNYFDVIQSLRERSYFQENHLNGTVRINKNSNNEKNTVKRIVFGNQHLGELDLPVDFEVPLNQWQDGGLGDIDLLTFNRETNSFYIVETKSITSGEQALRAILEIATYREMIEEEVIIEEYRKVLRDYYKHRVNDNSIIYLKAVILLFKGSDTADQIKANDSRGRVLRALAHKLAIQVFILHPPEEPIRLNLENEIV